MPLTARPLSRIRALGAGIALAAAALATSVVPTAATPPPPFTLSPDPVVFETTLNGFDYEFVDLTTGNRKVYMSSPQSTNLPFFDTQGGCWQSYGALGLPIPARTTCQLEIGFHPTSAGPFSDSLTVTACKKWHTDPTYGFILCDTLDGSASVGLEGTVDLPDLVITQIKIGDGGASSYGYRVTVKNQGVVTADISGMGVQGYWSSDGTTFDPSTQNGACGTTFPASTSLAPGASTSITVGCSTGNVSGEGYLGVEVDSGEAVVESDETNNVAFEGLPDLIPYAISIDGPSGAHPFNATVTVKNVGNGPAVVDLIVLTVAARYSSDATFDSGDTPACGDLLYTSPGTLAAGATIDAHIGCDATPAGTDAYYVVQVDYPNPKTVIPEIDETNNFGSTALP